MESKQPVNLGRPGQLPPVLGNAVIRAGGPALVPLAGQSYAAGAPSGHGPGAGGWQGGGVYALGTPSPRRSGRESGSLGACSSWASWGWVTLNGLGRPGCSVLEQWGGRAAPRTVAGPGGGSTLVGWRW